MSEFRIIKCKKCDAALTELEGEKLTHCIQCGYQFGGIEKKPNSTFHARIDQMRKAKQAKVSRPANLSKSTTSSKSTISSRSKSSNKRSKKPLPAASKRKAPIWFTIVKWYIIISVVIGIISGIFR